MCIYTFLF